MAHARQEIREAAKAALLGADAPDIYATDAGARVYETRVVPWRRLELPAIAVYTLEESVAPESQNTAPRELARTVQLAIEGAIKQADNIDDALDDLALQIERAMHADPTLGDKASDSILSSTELDILEDGDRLVGLVRLVYSVTFYTYAPEADDVELDDLSTVDVRHSLSNAVDEDDQAEDLLQDLED